MQGREGLECDKGGQIDIKEHSLFTQFGDINNHGHTIARLRGIPNSYGRRGARLQTTAHNGQCIVNAKHCRLWSREAPMVEVLRLVECTTIYIPLGPMYILNQQI